MGFTEDQMEITESQYARIAPHLPVQCGNTALPNLQVPNATLYMAKHGCKWRGLPKRFGNRHTIYTRMNRWSKNEILARGSSICSGNGSYASSLKRRLWTTASPKFTPTGRER